jgi:hypothetical protein
VRLARSKRTALVLLAMTEGDEECLRVMAGVFERMAQGFGTNIY